MTPERDALDALVAHEARLAELRNPYHHRKPTDEEREDARLDAELDALASKEDAHETL